MSHPSNTATHIPPALRSTYHFTAREVEFLAEYESIQIVPLFKSDPIRLLEHKYGPFQPQIRISVPLWLAIFLKQCKKCQIIPPAWLHPQRLEEFLQEEMAEKSAFKEVPYHMVEVFTLLYDNAIDDIDSTYGHKSHIHIQSLMKDIEEQRRAKISKGLEALATMTRNTVVKLNYVSAMELCEIRPLALYSVNRIARYSSLEDTEHQPKKISTGAAPAAVAASVSSSRRETQSQQSVDGSAN